jgi:Flp pilus assembly protein TadG
MTVGGSSRTRSPRERGNAMVEFALAFSLLVPVFLGAFQFGYAFYIYNELQTAVRAGARYASVATYNSATATPSSTFATAVRNVVVYGDPNPTGSPKPIVPGLTPSNVNLTVQFEQGIPRWVRVGIRNYRLYAVVNALNLSAKPEATIAYVGRFDPT